MDRRKELKQMYKQMKPDMGIVLVRSKNDKRCALIASKNLRGTVNRLNFSFDDCGFLIRGLRKAWKEQGRDAFDIEVLDRLEYDKDESKTDYTEDLETLAEVWSEKLSAQGFEFYEK